MPAGLTRVAAPAAVLLVATVVLLLVRPALRDAGPAPPQDAATTRATTATQPTRPAPRRVGAARPPAAAPELYEIRAGDTLGAVAERHDTTVETLVGLNPGVDPTALQVGQTIRVK